MNKIQEQKKLFNLLNKSIEKVYTNFSKVIQIEGLEQCLVGIVYAYFFQEIQLSEYKNLDLNLEYNKNGAFVKSTPNYPNGIRPDIILHKIGDNQENKIVVEFKGWWNKQDERDIKKLKELTDPTGEYKYLLGVWVMLNKDKPSYKFVIDGIEKNNLYIE